MNNLEINLKEISIDIAIILNNVINLIQTMAYLITHNVVSIFCQTFLKEFFYFLPLSTDDPIGPSSDKPLRSLDSLKLKASCRKILMLPVKLKTKDFPSLSVNLFKI